MRDLLSKLDAIVSETELKNPEDLQAKRKALADLEKDPVASGDPEISSAITQRKLDLEKEAKAKGFAESFQVGDEFGISFSEDHEIATTIVDILEDGIVVELDDLALEMLTNEGLEFLEGELVEDKVKGTHGKACWKGYRRVGKNDCTKIGESQGNVKHKASQYQEDMDNPNGSGGLVFYAKNPDGTKTYALVKDAAHLADLERRHSKSEIKQLDFQRKDVYDWLESRGVNLRRFVPGAETTTTPGNESVEESGLQRYTGIKKYGKDGFEALQKAGREGADEEEKGRIKDKYLKKEDHGPENPDAPINYGEYDREGDMAKDDLRTIDDAVEELYSMLTADENLPEWVQSKITKAADYIDTARDYMKAQKYEEGVTEADALRARGGIEAVNKKPRPGQTDYRDIPAGNYPGSKRKFSDKDREEQPSRLKAAIKSSLGKHKRPNLPEQGVAEGAEDLTPNMAKYVLDQIYNSNGDVTMTDLFDEGIPGLRDMFMATADELGLDPDEDFMDVESAVLEKLEDLVKGGNGMDEGEVDEAKYQGREVPLGKKMAGDVKKSKVYVRKPNGNIVKVNFGDKKMRIKKSNPARRKSFRARHNCANPGPRHKARYWSCRSW